jgi:D-alanyl-D-alanine carboxypeptidase
MLFAIGSAQKMFVGAAILQLAEEGKISLDDSLYKWHPPYPYIDSTITIRQILNHTSGLYNFVDNSDYWQAIFNDPTKIWTMEEIILSFNREPLFPKGTGWHYSQTGYNMLRMIIKKITGSEIPEVNSNRFWIPLELNHFFTSKEGELPANFAHGWLDLDKDGSYEDFSSFSRTAFVSGIGGEIWATAEDLAKWARDLFYNKKVLSQASLDQMLTFHAPCTGEEFICAGYGLSVVKFNPQPMNGLEAIGHGGNAPGYAAACIFIPDFEICIGLLDNTEEGEVIGAAINNMLDVISDYFGE